MKKLNKIIAISICILLAICLLNTTVYSLSISEVKEAIKFKTVQDNGEPKKYDVEIDAEELIENPEFPYIQTSIEKILYGKDNLTDINFLDGNTKNKNEKWQYICTVVKAFYRICLYIAFALLLSFIIYFGVTLVISSIKGDNNKTTFSNPFRRRRKRTPEQDLRDKKFIEQWIKCVLLLSLSAVIINLIINFSDLIIKMANIDDVEKNNNITVYVKGEDDSPEKNYYFKTNIEGLLMFESQYQWDKAPVKNVINIICGFIVTVFKLLLKALMFLRMLFIAGLTMAFPIILMINAFCVIIGNKGPLKFWFKLFLYCVLIKPLIAILYYVLVEFNPYLISEFSLYIIFVIALIILAIILSFRFFVKSFK